MEKKVLLSAWQEEMLIKIKHLKCFQLVLLKAEFNTTKPSHSTNILM